MPSAPFEPRGHEMRCQCDVDMKGTRNPDTERSKTNTGSAEGFIASPGVEEGHHVEFTTG